jgi:hypothetical protein
VIISTGEDVPRGHSLRARMFVVEVGRGDVDADRLTECQRAAAAGTYAAATAGYIRWLAERYAEVLADLKAATERLRAEAFAALGDGSHRRTPAVVADLMAGFWLYLRFAHDAGAVDEVVAEALLNRCRSALLGVAREQASYHEASDPADRYLALLASALSSGRAHAAGPDGTRPADTPQAWGWRPSGDARDPGVQWQPQGRRVGWVDGADLYLEPDAAYAEIQRLGNEQGEPLAVSRDTLHRRLRERGLLASTEASRRKILVRHTFEGGRRAVLHLSAARVLYAADEGPNGPIGPPGPEPFDPQHVARGPFPREADGVGPSKRPTTDVVGPSQGPTGPEEPGKGPRATHCERNACERSGPVGPFGPSSVTHNTPGGVRDGTGVREVTL